MTTVLTLILADDIRQEAGGKYTAVGLYFNVALGGKESKRGSSKAVFATVSDLQVGTHKISVKFVNSNYEVATDWLGQDFEVTRGEDEIFTFVLRTDEFYFPASGMYRMHLVIDDEIVGTQLINITYETEPEHGFVKPDTSDAGSPNVA